ncbi:MAG: hypothetical protein KGL39_31665 [Patescibacteria group bacterium]|nr:hypothetical protein [Patescibacteria group bacterium]
MSEHADQPAAPRLHITVIRADGTIEDHGTVEARLLPASEAPQPERTEEEGE